MTDTSQLVEIHIVGMPMDIYREASEHSDELLREFALIREGDTDGSREVPRRLLMLIDELRERFTVFTAAQETAIRDALERGDETIDLVYRVPASVRAAVVDLGSMLDEADEFCHQGQELLTLATPPRALTFRRWFLDEFVRQIDGGEPRSWPEYAG